MYLAHHLWHLLIPHHSNNQRAKLLHPSALALVIVFFLIFQYLLNQTSAAFPQILGFASQIPASEIVRLTNLERQNRGLPELKLDPLLTEAASRKASDMLARNYWAHVSPLGVQPWSFISEAGYSYRYAGENLARDFSDPSSIVRAWIASPSHRDNLLSNRYQDIGVAVVDGVLDGRETTIVVQMFGSRLSPKSTPAVGKTASFTVFAAESTPVPLPTMAAIEPVEVQVADVKVPPASPFEITKIFSLGLLSMFALVLVLDIIIAHRKCLIRWTGKSLAHLMFIVVLLIAISSAVRGKIL